MRTASPWKRVSVVAVLFTLLALAPLAAGHGHGHDDDDIVTVSDYPFATPIFGLTSVFDGHLFVADAGAGIVRLKRGGGDLFAALPGVSDMAPTLFGMWAITGGTGPGNPQTPTSSRLYWVTHSGAVHEVANLATFEETVNPDAPEVNPNPFDVAAYGTHALVADAGGNDLLIVDRDGKIDWVATLPVEPTPTDNVKSLFHCPAGPPDICSLPPMLPTQPVATSIAVGPDGYFYMGELKGFPAPAGKSKVWRIKPTARHARCGSSPDCTVVADGFTSIIDLAFGPNGTLHVVELDEASWFAVEVLHAPTTGTVNACRRNPWTGTFKCVPEATGLVEPIAATVDWRGRVFVATHALEPGEAEIVALP